jgi:hypothetical protein
MPTPTLIIGIGSSGLFTLEHVQRFYYETYGKNKPENVEYLFIETDKDNQVGITPEKNEIGRVYISLGEMENMIYELQKDGYADWLPPSVELLNAGLGAGGIRSCGRLALWGCNSTQDNFKNVIEAIVNAYGRIMPEDDKGSEKENSEKIKPTVFITGTLTGGTGSGILIDMGYLVRYLIKDINELFGLFLLPKNPTSIRGLEVAYANSYAALKDLDHYNKADTVYKENWPNGVQAKFTVPPYELVQFISQDYNDGSPALSNLGALYKMAGLYLYLNIAGVRKKRMARVIDGKSAVHIDKYGTFGLSAIQFPKDQIQEYLALSLSKDLIGRWTDSENYFVNNVKKPINPSIIAEKSSKLFDEFIDKAFKILNIVGGENLTNDIERRAIEINSKSIQGHSDDYIRNLFSSSVNTSNYNKVKDNIQSARNSLVDAIHDQIIKELDETENLYYVKTFLESINNAISETLQHWNKFQLDENTESWENLLQGLCSDSINNTFKLVLQHDEVLTERLLNIFEVMKMHLLMRPLKEISNSISKEELHLISSVNYNELPKTGLIEQFIHDLSGVTKTDSKDTVFTFDRRMISIEQDVTDKTIPILRIYPSDSFKTETENAKQIYIQKTKNNARTKDEIEIIKNTTLWDYLIKCSRSGFHHQIYTDCIKGYRLSINKVECVPDFDVAEYIIKHPTKGISYARKSLSPFISFERILKRSPVLPKFIAGGNENTIKKVLEIFKQSQFNDFSDSPDGMLELTDLRNILIFYSEMGNFNLLEDLSYISQMERVYSYPPESQKKTTEKWLNERNAYKY